MKKLRSWAEVESRFNLTGAICRKPAFDETPNLWETVSGRIKPEDRIARWEQAAALCEQCPVLEKCKARLDFYTALGFSIDGVVAGRIPELPARHCRGCGKVLYEKGEQQGVETEYCAGFCRHCYERRKRK